MILKAFRKRHAKQTWHWMNDAKIAIPFGRTAKLSKRSHEDWFRQLKHDKTKIMFAIATSGSNKHVGNIGLKTIDSRHRAAEIWVYIGDHNYQRKGIAKKAVNQIVSYAFKKLRLHRIEARVFEDNTASIRLFKKCGFQKEGELCEVFYHSGKFRNQWVLARLKK